MNDGDKLENDMKVVGLNNELTMDVKSELGDVVIPISQGEEKKVEPSISHPEYDITITNTEVRFFIFVCIYL